ncbi:hypothetical protein [Streptomyces sp. NPDC060194]|uniref:hypothetical protein n=1 Tax=Streptomyces sp. NPDC060194 TaxID=3347069 RepID=UPI003657AD1E
MSSDGVVADGAVRAAWDACGALDPGASAASREAAEARVAAAVSEFGREEVSRGTLFLVGVLTGYLVAERPGGGAPSDPLTDLIPSVVRRLPAFPAAAPEHVPMATGLLMAAAMGMDTVAWRDGFGPLPAEEALLHGFVLRLLADLFDTLAGRPGVIDRLMRETFAAMGPERD